MILNENRFGYLPYKFISTSSGRLFASGGFTQYSQVPIKYVAEFDYGTSIWKAVGDFPVSGSGTYEVKSIALHTSGGRKKKT